MIHKITFLGTAGDLKTAANYKSAGGFIVLTQGYQLHFEPGIGAIECAKKNNVNLRNNVAVIATSNSILSCNDLNAVADYMTLEGEDRHGVLIGAVSIINGSNNENPILKETSRKYLERVIGLKAGDKVAIAEIDVYAQRIDSKDSTAIGIIIDSAGYKIGYIPESGFMVSIAKSYEGVDTLILSLKHPTSYGEAKTMNVTDAIKFIDIAKPKHVIVTGLGFKLASEQSINLLRDLQKKTGIPTIVAEDEQTISLTSYKKHKQETLEEE